MDTKWLDKFSIYHLVLWILWWVSRYELRPRTFLGSVLGMSHLEEGQGKTQDTLEGFLSLCWPVKILESQLKSVAIYLLSAQIAAPMTPALDKAAEGGWKHFIRYIHALQSDHKEKSFFLFHYICLHKYAT